MPRLVRSRKRRSAITVATRSSTLVLMALQGLQGGLSVSTWSKSRARNAKCLDAGPHITRSRE